MDTDENHHRILNGRTNYSKPYDEEVNIFYRKLNVAVLATPIMTRIRVLIIAPSHIFPVAL